MHEKHIDYMKRVLVLGGAGFIGSHTCTALKQAGYLPVVLDNLVYGHIDAVKWGPFEKGDISNPVDLDRVIEKHRPELVMHFAAFAYVGESVQEPSKYYQNNVCGSICLLDAMRRHGLDRIVFSSSCATYGEVSSLPITEACPQLPVNPYGFTKLVIERALADYGAAYGIRAVTFRYFNAAGADPDGELGERHDPETHAIPLAIRAALGRGVFKVFGADYPTPDGTAIRDYIHVSDLADAHVRALAYLIAGGTSIAVNLATGSGTSVKEMIDAVERALSRPVPAEYVSRRAGDPPVLFASPARAHELLGWKPRFKTIDEIVATAANWFERHD
jgi:UDP-glucose-4-epimerase GalE